MKRKSLYDAFRHSCIPLDNVQNIASVFSRTSGILPLSPKETSMKPTYLFALVLVPAAAFAADTNYTSSSSDMNKTSSTSSAKTSTKTTKIQDINNHQSKWLNEKVTVSGEVIQSAPDMLVIDGKGIFNDRILVINSSAKKNEKRNTGNTGSEATSTGSTTGRNFSTNAEVTVPGTVRRMTLSEVRREYIANPPQEITTEYTTAMPVIVTDFNKIQTASASDMNQSDSGSTSQQ